MATTKPIHEVKDQLSRVIAEVEATGQPVNITRHGKIVAVIGPPPPDGVVLGAGARHGVSAPSLHELAWSSNDFDGALDAPIEPA